MFAELEATVVILVEIPAAVVTCFIAANPDIASATVIFYVCKCAYIRSNCS